MAFRRRNRDGEGFIDGSWESSLEMENENGNSTKQNDKAKFKNASDYYLFSIWKDDIVLSPFWAFICYFAF